MRRRRFRIAYGKDPSPRVYQISTALYRVAPKIFRRNSPLPVACTTIHIASNPGSLFDAARRQFPARFIFTAIVYSGSQWLDRFQRFPLLTRTGFALPRVEGAHTTLACHNGARGYLPLDPEVVSFTRASYGEEASRCAIFGLRRPRCVVGRVRTEDA
jgi:hypothetical protein